MNGRCPRRSAARSVLLAMALLVAGAAGADCAANRDPAAQRLEAVRATLMALPPYRPAAEVGGTIRLWGHGSPKHDFMGKLVHRWTALFHRYQPAVKIVDQMYGTASAIGALYTGAGDIAILGEEISPAAAAAFRRERHYAPVRIDIATGSVDANYFDYAQMIFVNHANPIRRLTLAQLDAVFGAEHRRGPRNIRTWGGLGLGEDWTNRRIQPLAWKADEDFGLFFSHRVLEDSHRWNPATREFVTRVGPGGVVSDRGRQILDALDRDRTGIAVSNVRFADPQVKVVALAVDAAGPYVCPTPANLIAQRYPLTRVIPAFIDVPPGGAARPAVREFLKFILSREGQQAIVEDSGYLPLGASTVRAQLATLRRVGDGGDDGGGAGAPRQAASAPTAPTGRRIRVWGNPALRRVGQRWAQGFRAGHPHVRVLLHLTGSDTAMAGLYTGKADVALLGRAATDSEIKAFEWIFHRPPARVRILRGSVERQGRSPALVAFVQRRNPLARIDCAQLAEIIEHRPARGGRRIRTWGDLGIGGAWAHRPIDVYLPESTSGTGRFLRDNLVGGSAVLDWGRIKEFTTVEHVDGTVLDSRPQILEALAHDPDGLALTHLPDGGLAVKPLALAMHAAGPYYTATRARIIDGRYPLGRTVFAYLNPGSGSADADVRAWLRYVRSPDGQALVRAHDGYLPLPTGR